MSGRAFWIFWIVVAGLWFVAMGLGLQGEQRRIKRECNARFVLAETRADTVEVITNHENCLQFLGGDL